MKSTWSNWSNWRFSTAWPSLLSVAAGGRKGLDSVCLDAIICGLGGPHFGAPAGPLFNIFRHPFSINTGIPGLKSASCMRLTKMRLNSSARNARLIPGVMGVRFSSAIFAASVTTWLILPMSVLRIISTGEDPFIYTHDVPAFSHAMRLKFKMKSNIPGPGLFFYTDSQIPGFSPDKRIQFEMIADENWHDYSIDFYPEGNLKGLRLDPGNAEGCTDSKWISLERRYGEILKKWVF